MSDSTFSVDVANQMGEKHLPGLIGIEFNEIEHGRVVAELAVEKRHKTPHDFLHAATIIALADTAAGYGVLASLPKGAKSFTTIDLQCNFVGTRPRGNNSH